MIIYQNVVIEAQFKKFEIFSCSYFKPLHQFQRCDVMMNLSTPDRVHFWIYLLDGKSKSNNDGFVDFYSFEGMHHLIKIKISLSSKSVGVKQVGNVYHKLNYYLVLSRILKKILKV